jgi:type IV pilus assembly protein PilN
MITINLLPHRELARKKRKEQFIVHIGLSVALGLAISLGVHSVYNRQIDSQQERNQLIQAEIEQLDARIKDIATLQLELDGLRSRQQAVESLQADRSLPVHFLEDMAALMPEGVSLRSFKQENLSVSITGVALSQARVSELLRNLASQSQRLTEPQLLEITAGAVTLSQRDQRSVFNFSVRLTLSKGAGEAPGGKD